MEAVSAIGSCLEHADRAGTPCARCGTFRCAECLSDGLCTRCREASVRPVTSADVVGFGRRAGGRILDLVVGYAVGLAGGIFAAIALTVLQSMNLAEPGWAARFDHGFGFNLLSGLTSDIAGASVSTWLCGASVGKALLGLRVVRVDGGRAGLGAALTREVVYLVDAFFFGLVAKSAMDQSELQQRHGDRLAGTAVIRADAISRDTAFSGPRLLVGLVAGIGVHLVVLAAFFVAAGR